MGHKLWLSASAVALIWTGAAHAQAQSSSPSGTPKSSADATVAELVVTAERRTENLQTTAIAATVITGEDLAAKGVLTVDQLQFALPGVTVNNFGQGNDFNIRGIGKAEHNSQTTTGVITYRDGVATFPGYFQEEPYFDIARVEVLRGPQGTFVGQNATGGAVFVTSVDPVIDGGHHGYISGQVGNYADAAAQGAINLPVSDTFAARLAFNTERRDSFYDITGPGSNNPGVGEGSFRLGLLWKPSSSLSVLVKTDYSYLNLGAYPAVPVLATNDPFHLTMNYPQKALDRFVRSDLKIDYVLDNGITLRSISGFQKGNTRYQTDLDGTSAANFTFGDLVDDTIWSQEFNLISPDKGPVTYVLGAYLQTDKLDFLPGHFFIGEPAGSVFTEYRLQGINPKQTEALFGQVSFKLAQGLELQLGARYSGARTTNHVSVLQFGTPIQADQTEKFSNTSGKVSLNWTIDPHNFVYGFVATGFRAGGLNVPVGLGLPAPFGPDRVRGGLEVRLLRRPPAHPGRRLLQPLRKLPGDDRLSAVPHLRHRAKHAQSDEDLRPRSPGRGGVRGVLLRRRPGPASQRDRHLFRHGPAHRERDGLRPGDGPGEPLVHQPRRARADLCAGVHLQHRRPVCVRSGGRRHDHAAAQLRPRRAAMGHAVRERGARRPGRAAQHPEHPDRLDAPRLDRHALQHEPHGRALCGRGQFGPALRRTATPVRPSPGQDVLTPRNAGLRR